MSEAKHTPETDFLLASQFDDRMPMSEAYPQMVDHARKLEQQRDAALERERGLREALQGLMWRFDDDDADPNSPNDAAPDIAIARKVLK